MNQESRLKWSEYPTNKTLNSDQITNTNPCHIHPGEECDPLRRDLLPAGDVSTAGVVRGAGASRGPQPGVTRARVPRQRPPLAAESHWPAQGMLLLQGWLSFVLLSLMYVVHLHHSCFFGANVFGQHPKAECYVAHICKELGCGEPIDNIC